MLNCPCHKCTDRWVEGADNCHNHCDAYKMYCEDNEARKESMREEYRINYPDIEWVTKQREKARKNRRNK